MPKTNDQYLAEALASRKVTCVNRVSSRVIAIGNITERWRYTVDQARPFIAANPQAFYTQATATSERAYIEYVPAKAGVHEAYLRTRKDDTLKDNLDNLLDQCPGI